MFFVVCWVVAGKPGFFVVCWVVAGKPCFFVTVLGGGWIAMNAVLEIYNHCP